MVAKTFQVVGIVAIILAGLIAIPVFHFLSKGLKRLNESIGSRRSEIHRDLRVSLEELDGAQGQLDQISAATEVARAGMSSALAAADATLAFLRSNAFQVGVPVAMWSILLAVTIPKSLARHRKKRLEPIPPPSWQEAAEQEERAGL